VSQGSARLGEARRRAPGRRLAARALSPLPVTVAASVTPGSTDSLAPAAGGLPLARQSHESPSLRVSFSFSSVRLFHASALAPRRRTSTGPSALVPQVGYHGSTPSRILIRRPRRLSDSARASESDSVPAAPRPRPGAHSVAARGRAPPAAQLEDFESHSKRPPSPALPAPSLGRPAAAARPPQAHSECEAAAATAWAAKPCRAHSG
jgi:hypothetical protein